jgi:hypothetical protein
MLEQEGEQITNTKTTPKPKLKATKLPKNENTQETKIGNKFRDPTTTHRKGKERYATDHYSISKTPP